MITKTASNRYGVCEFAITEVSDIDLIETNGLASSSIAVLINESGMRVFMFAQTKDNKGKWCEI